MINERTFWRRTLSFCTSSPRLSLEARSSSESQHHPHPPTNPPPYSSFYETFEPRDRVFVWLKILSLSLSLSKIQIWVLRMSKAQWNVDKLNYEWSIWFVIDNCVCVWERLFSRSTMIITISMECLCDWRYSLFLSQKMKFKSCSVKRRQTSNCDG